MPVKRWYVVSQFKQINFSFINFPVPIKYNLFCTPSQYITLPQLNLLIILVAYSFNYYWVPAYALPEFNFYL